jgi:hypothetical protein
MISTPIERNSPNINGEGLDTPMGQTPLPGLPVCWQDINVTIFRNSSPQKPSGGFFRLKGQSQGDRAARSMAKLLFA